MLVVRVDALPAARNDPDALDLRRLGARSVVLAGDASGEQLLLRDGVCNIRLQICSGTLLDGQVRLRYLLEGMAELDHKLLTLRRLVMLRRLGRFPAGLFPPDQRATRWILLLRVLDALATGASQREIAAGLFGGALVTEDWRTRSDYLRFRVQRLVRTGSDLVDGGYLTLLGGRPPL